MKTSEAENLAGLKADRQYRHFTVALVTLVVILALLMLADSPVLAAAESSGDEAQRPGLGGPRSVETQIESDRATREIKLYEAPFLKPYFGWKDELADKHGFSFGIDYTAVGLKFSDNLAGTDDEAFGGVFRFYGSWELFGRGTETPGTLTWRVTHGHKYSDTAPIDSSLTSLGNVSVFDPLHDDSGTKLANLYWRQSWKNGGIQFIGGYFDTADLIEFYPLTDPLTAFRNLAFLTGAGTVPLPPAGSLGFVGAAWLNDNVYVSSGIVDSNGDPNDVLDGFDTFFNDNEYFTFAEIGWTTSQDKVYLDNIHLTLWHVDERDMANTEDGWGAVFSYSRWLQDRYLPFLKVGYADDGSSLLETSVSAGIGYQPWHDGGIGHVLGLGVNWGEPNSTVLGPGLDDQYAIEAFFRWQLSKELAVTPDVQFLINPALNPDENNTWVFGLRARLAL